MRDATQPKAPSVLYKGIQLTQQLFFFPFGKRIPFNCQLKMVSAAREQEWQPLYSRQQDYFQLLSPFQLQWTAVRQTMKGLVSLLFWFLSFFFVVLIVLLGYCWLSVFAGLVERQDRTHTEQAICQLLPLPQELPRAPRLRQNLLGWLWHQPQMSPC